MSECEQRTCSNCNKEFPSDKIDLHQAYCCRRIRKCPDCSQMVDIQDLQEHNKQNHQKKPCTYCSEQIAPKDLTNHQAACPRRPGNCQFCENQYAHAELPRHQEMCGARTKNCPQCQKIVSLKDFPAHEARCIKRNQDRREQRNQLSQDHYVPRQRHQAQRVERERQNSTNNLREPQPRSNSIQNNNLIPKPAKIKPNNIIGPDTFKGNYDPIPISVRMMLDRKDNRPPLKAKN